MYTCCVGDDSVVRAQILSRRCRRSFKGVVLRVTAKTSSGVVRAVRHGEVVIRVGYFFAPRVN